ncbi:hypothetical protein M8J76_017161 [Diaphorina citri]|uniref:ATP-binding cassette sub-family G member 13 n=1 Tax=Diaphorina citri TaxID=121845 RepID=A0A3R5YN91_DIACI|nr:hypothetical protein M8J76_017161 [Diaphorina citri]KAI5752730.1 hypothetical protein M8J77_019834 [Diaphorina citri]QAA95929.1 ATP-binding cassette sub-family G member 13 [Diaphorina citri]QER78512.1 ATP-binding cassette transporter [Diaphorina citri]
MDQTASTSKTVILFKNNEEVPNVDFSESLLTNSEFGDYTEGVNLTWRELCVYAPQKKESFFRTTKTSYKRIVNNVTGAALSGTLVAIMGASGAGKSTLLAALSQRLPDDCIIDGDIRVNGKPVEGKFRSACGFMYQHDLFSPSLTVYEHLYFMALLKLDRRVKAYQRIALINSLLIELGLMNSQHTRIGSSSITQKVVLSGGERKRLSFATELLTDPALLLCDEPTTGLDSFSASKLIRMMRELTSQRKKTVLCTIHQPSSELIDMFDKIILLADSRTAFIGSKDAALAFLESQGYPCPYGYNPADFLIKSLAVTTNDELSSRRRLKRICDEFSVCDFAKEVDLEINYQTHVGTYDFLADFNSRKIKKPFWFTIIYVLISRSFLNVVRDPAIQLSKLFQKVATALMCGLCFAGSIDLTQRGVQSVQGALFIMVTENTFSPMYSVLSQFPDMLPLFHREYSSGLYSAFQFYLSYILSSLPGLIIQAVLFTVILYWISGLRNSLSVFLMAVLICILIINVATSCGIMFSLAFSSVSTAMACLVPFDYTLMITAGVFYKLSSLPPYFVWIRYLSWLEYSNEALTITQWQGVTNITCFDNPDLPCLEDGAQVINNMNFSPDNLYPNLIAMVVLYFAFHTLAFLFLLMKSRPKS